MLRLEGKTQAAESNEDAAIGAMSHFSGSSTGSTETMSEAIGVYELHRTASSTEWCVIAICQEKQLIGQ